MYAPSIKVASPDIKKIPPQFIEKYFDELAETENYFPKDAIEFGTLEIKSHDQKTKHLLSNLTERILHDILSEYPKHRNKKDWKEQVENYIAHLILGVILQKTLMVDQRKENYSIRSSAYNPVKISYLLTVGTLKLLWKTGWIEIVKRGYRAKKGKRSRYCPSYMLLKEIEKIGLRTMAIRKAEPRIPIRYKKEDNPVDSPEQKDKKKEKEIVESVESFNRARINYPLEKHPIIKFTKTDLLSLSPSRKRTFDRLLQHADFMLIPDGSVEQFAELRSYSGIDQLLKDHDQKTYTFKLYLKYVYRSFPVEFFKNGKPKKNKFDKNGRFVDDVIQGLSKEWREKIMFGEQSSVELDYETFYPNIAYALIGKEPPENVYITKKGIDPVGDAVRGWAKMALNSCFGTPSKESAVKAVRNNLRKKENSGLRGTEILWRSDSDGSKNESSDSLVETVVDINSDLDQFFFNNSIGTLMGIESSIANEVIKKFVEKDIPIIGVHDSFLVPRQYKEMLQKTMVKSFQFILKTNNEIKVG